MATVEELVARNRWSQARERIQEELISAPTDHWLWLTLSLTYYEQKQYEKALQCSKRAVELQPDCPLALWHLAGSLFMSGREDAALAIWTLLLDMDVEKVAYGECGEGMDWALQLLNDTHYRVGRYYEWKGDAERAGVSYRKYLHNRAHGVGSIYDEKPVIAYLTLNGLANLAEERAGTKSSAKPAARP
jgi:tetratricopeptide (TPR) repeat protein